MLGLFLSQVSSTRWAVLIAGSNDFYNYRHQADISTIYTQLSNRGFDDEHIVQLAYDDIARSSSNPFKGQIFHTLQHVNIYPGSSKIDYSGKKVTAQQFYDVLTGLPSTSDDYVYVYYDNHGGPGILGVPDGVSGGYIQAEDLTDAFTTMSNKKLYKYLFFGIEACYAGSVAEVFTAPNMATITASNNQESSYAAVMDSAVGTYLTNEFTNYYIQFCDEHPDQTIGDLYDFTKKSTTGSHVTYYGDESLKAMKLADFMGTPNGPIVPAVNKRVDIVPHYLATKSTLTMLSDSVDSVVAGKARIALHDLISSSNKLELTLTEVTRQLDPASAENALSAKCGKISSEYFEVLEYFTTRYGKVNGDDLTKLSVLVNLANRFKVGEIKAAINTIV